MPKHWYSIHAIMTHNHYTDEEREVRGISLGLVCVSVGLKNVEDLSADIMQTLDHDRG
jgi:cystathionine beta-lyase/cystathionine gamma-synthase